MKQYTKIYVSICKIIRHLLVLVFILSTSKGVKKMIITRWQAAKLPTIEQARIIFSSDELAPFEESLESGQKIKDHRHPFDEIRMVISGELFMNISGNQVLLRAGDKIKIPANTKHSKTAQGNTACLCLVANTPF